MKPALSALLASAFVLPLVAAPAPEISLSLRGAENHTVEVGEPIFVAVRIDVPEDSGAAIELSPASGTWADAVDVEITGLKPGASKLRARPALPPENASTTLNTESNASGVWFVASSAAAQLAPGEYVVKARLAISGGRGWNGESLSEETAFHVVASSNAPERVRQRVMARAYEAVLANSPEEAARLLDAQLTSDPNDISLLIARGALCVRGNDYRSAMICVNRAIDRFERGGGKHPPADLFELENRVSLALLSPATPEVIPPSWTRLPPAVVSPWEEKRSPTSASSAVAAAPGAVVPTSSQPGNTISPKLVQTPTPTTSPVVLEPNDAPAGAASLGAVVPAGELTDAKVSADAAGQWAASATAGSQYDKKQYSAAQAAGAPNISVAGNSPDAWCPAKKNDGTEWLEVSFPKPVHATEVRIRQNDAPGCISKIEAIEPDGTAHIWWEGVDPFVAPATREIVWFGVRVPKTSYLVAKVKITLNLAAVSGWKEIDAVQLLSGD